MTGDANAMKGFSECAEIERHEADENHKKNEAGCGCRGHVFRRFLCHLIRVRPFRRLLGESGGSSPSAPSSSECSPGFSPRGRKLCTAVRFGFVRTPAEESLGSIACFSAS